MIKASKFPNQYTNYKSCKVYSNKFQQWWWSKAQYSIELITMLVNQNYKQKKDKNTYNKYLRLRDRPEQLVVKYA